MHGILRDAYDEAGALSVDIDTSPTWRTPKPWVDE